MSDDTPTTHRGPGYRDQSRKRLVFRVLGVLFMGTALVLIGLSVADFFAHSDFDDPQFGEAGKAWMFLAALPFFVLGGGMLQLGFAGAGARYMAGEYTPVLKDSMDHLGIRGSAAAEGSGPYCRSCGTRNDADARFCDGCGTSMAV